MRTRPRDPFTRYSVGLPSLALAALITFTLRGSRFVVVLVIPIPPICPSAYVRTAADQSIFALDQRIPDQDFILWYRGGCMVRIWYEKLRLGEMPCVSETHSTAVHLVGKYLNI